jgi:hypothetical protein
VGQLIEVEVTRLGTVAMFDTDRSLSGQDGESYASEAEAAAGTTFPARLAERLLDHDDALVNVYVYSNTVSITRSTEWSEADADAIVDIVRNFLVHYEENRQQPA